MPASEIQQGQRALRLAPILFWCGVGLAPVAALLLLVASSSGPIRLAAALAVLAVILVGLSIALRRDPESVRAELEQLVLDEIDGLRDDLRQDITVAARATHKALGEPVAALHETVEALRGQVEYLRGQLDRGGAPAPASHTSARASVTPPSAASTN